MLSSLIGDELTPTAFIFPSLFFPPASSVCSQKKKKKSQFLLPFSTSLELTWTFLSITYLTPFCSPSLSLSCSFPSIHLTANNLPSFSYWAFQSTPTTVVWEHLLRIKISISLLFSSLSFTNDAKKAAVPFWKEKPPPTKTLQGFCSIVLPLPSLLLPSSPAETESQRCGLHKTIISPLNTGEIYCLAFSPRTRHESWCNIIQIHARTEMKLHRRRNRPQGEDWQMMCGKKTNWMGERTVEDGNKREY